MLTPKLEILPHPQRRLWDELRQTPKEFVLYRGTAPALRLGHRQSEDFDFFSNVSFAPESLRKRVQYVQGAEVSQSEANTLTVIVQRDGPVKISFFGGLNLNRVQDPDVILDNEIQVASMLDVAATKLATIQQRAQARDYEDLAAIVGGRNQFGRSRWSCSCRIREGVQWSSQPESTLRTLGMGTYPASVLRRKRSLGLWQAKST